MDTLGRPETGDVIQIWDWMSETLVDKIADHGEHGLIVGISKKSDTFLNGKGEPCDLSHIVEGDVFKVLLNRDEIVHVHRQWIRPIYSNKS
tara:strand:+ start:725 stop:997 length:273 start_codon:yes stop_codon:yes gene_type:complete